MNKFIAMMAILATTGLLAACQPGKPIEATAYEGHSMSAEKVDTSAPAPSAASSGKSGRTFEAQ